MVLPCAAQAPKVQTRAPAGQLSGKRTEGRKIQLALALSASRPAYSVTLAMPPHRSPSMSASLKRRSEEHTSELQSLMRISYAVFCLKKKNQKYSTQTQQLSPILHIHNKHTTQ